jgi:hypothetical protein
VVHRGEGFLRAADFESALAETGERLRRGHFMNEMKVNVEDGWGTRLFGDNVRIPDFLEESLGHSFL